MFNSCTSESTTTGGASTHGESRSPCESASDGRRTNGQQMSISVASLSLFFAIAKTMPKWLVRWLMEWPLPFSMGALFAAILGYSFLGWVWVHGKIACVYPTWFARLRDYSQDLDAILVAKPVKFTPEMTGMWQDHVGRALLKPAGQAPTNDTDATVDEAEDQSIFVWLIFVVFVCLVRVSFI